MGTSILATICAERLTKFLVRYSRAQSTNTHPIRCNTESLRRFFPVIDKIVQPPQKKAATAPKPMADSKYTSLWLHRPSLMKPRMQNGEVSIKKNLSSSLINKDVPVSLIPPRSPLSPVSSKFLTVQSKFCPAPVGLVPKISNLMQTSPSGTLDQQARTKSIGSRYSEYFPKPAHCQSYGEYLKKFESLKYSRNWQ